MQTIIKEGKKEHDRMKKYGTEKKVSRPVFGQDRKNI